MLAPVEIEFINVKKTFSNGAKVLDNFNLKVRKNESLVIIGRSGVGKSIMLKILLGLVRLSAGDVMAGGISVYDRKRRQQYLSKFSMMFQGGALFDSMTVEQNVIFGLMNRGTPKNEATKIAQEKLLAVELDKSVFKLYPSALSGGMQKRVALARAIALKPEIMLFDEPTSGLDPVTGATISQLIRGMIKKFNFSCITITHDLSAAQVVADRVALLDSGKIIWEDKVKALNSSDNPIVRHFMESSRWTKGRA
ncbi:MAG: ATP-binding cassette domain-containing protein [Holosporales bacterium]|jgi:phospholipid/cholesterol/gamma-HCH transport system ATP-binding protein|nr:ATP-binding cassette domain-containing protein [Holosporales bacterium]